MVEAADSDKMYSNNMLNFQEATCILWDGWPIFTILGSNEQLQWEFEYTSLKHVCHSWWILKMQSGRDDTLEKWYVIKILF